MQIPPAFITAFGRAASAVARHGPELVQCATAAVAAHAAQGGSHAAAAPAAAPADGVPPSAALRNQPGAAMAQRLRKQARAGDAGALRSAQEGFKQALRFNDELMDVLNKSG